MGTELQPAKDRAPRISQRSAVRLPCVANLKSRLAPVLSMPRRDLAMPCLIEPGPGLA